MSFLTYFDMFVVIIHQPLIHLISKHHHIVLDALLGDHLQLRLTVHLAKWIIRGVEEDGFGFAAEFTGKFLWV